MAYCEECEGIIRILDFDEPNNLGKLKKHLKELHNCYHHPKKFLCYSRAIEKRLYSKLSRNEI
jgi:hypothetical protein